MVVKDTFLFLSARWEIDNGNAFLLLLLLLGILLPLVVLARRARVILDDDGGAARSAPNCASPPLMKIYVTLYYVCTYIVAPVRGDWYHIVYVV